MPQKVSFSRVGKVSLLLEVSLVVHFLNINGSCSHQPLKEIIL